MSSHILPRVHNGCIWQFTGGECLHFCMQQLVIYIFSPEVCFIQNQTYSACGYEMNQMMYYKLCSLFKPLRSCYLRWSVIPYRPQILLEIWFKCLVLYFSFSIFFPSCISHLLLIVIFFMMGTNLQLWPIFEKIPINFQTHQVNSSNIDNSPLWPFFWIVNAHNKETRDKNSCNEHFWFKTFLLIVTFTIEWYLIVDRNSQKQVII